MTKITSWKGVYETETDIHVAENTDQLIALLNEGYVPVGNFHSYNRNSLHPKTVQLGREFNYIHMDGDKCVVGGGCTVRRVMQFLLDNDRKLLNYGNNFTQNFAGACLGGTHGFGENACVAEGVVTCKNENGKVYYLRDFLAFGGKCITEVRIKTEPLKQYKVTNCVCPLSKIGPQSENERAYAVLMYSGEDPICIVADYKNVTAHQTVLLEPEKNINSWWRLKLLNTFWWLDATLPFVRRKMQRLLNFAEMKTWSVVTDLKDLDPKYDQNMGVSTDTLNFGVWIQKPTHTAHNMSFACRTEDTQEIIKYTINAANKLKYGFLTNFIGVREMKGQGTSTLALNSDGPRDLIDLYCLPKHGKLFEILQNDINHHFDVKLHKSKSIQ